MERERPPSGPWDLKLSPGGLVDIEFAAQHLQLTHAAGGGPLRPNTAEALAELRDRGMADDAALAAAAGGLDPAAEPHPAAQGGAR
jgi:glutamate-ammonia-ligase adenylyltransferase